MLNLDALFDWMDLHNGKVPYYQSSDPVERGHGIMILTISMAKTGKTADTFHPEYLTQATERGYPDIFDKIEKKVLLAIIKTLQDVDDERRSMEVEDYEEHQHVLRMERIDRAMNVKLGSKNTFIPYQALPEDPGYPTILESSGT